MTLAKGGFAENPESLKKAKQAQRDKIRRKPLSSKEYNAWRTKKLKENPLW